MSYITPITLTLEEGTYEIQMPLTATVNSIAYIFSNWEDLSTNPNRTIILSADKAVQANYAVAPPPTGTLAIDTTPVKGEIFVNGTSWGIAPQSRAVNAGSYHIRFGDVLGYTAPSEEDVNVLAGLTATVTRTYAIIPPATGTLEIITTPVSGDIFIDGILYGTSPVKAILSPKKYTISFSEMQGYYPIPPMPVDVKAGQIATLLVPYIIRPPPSKGTLDIHVFSQGTEIMIAGKIVETGQTFTTPASIEVDPGVYTVEIIFNNVPQRTAASAFGGKITPVNIMLETPSPFLNKWFLIPASLAAFGAIIIVGGGGKKK